MKKEMTKMEILKRLFLRIKYNLAIGHDPVELDKCIMELYKFSVDVVNITKRWRIKLYNKEGKTFRAAEKVIEAINSEYYFLTYKDLPGLLWMRHGELFKNLFNEIYSLSFKYYSTDYTMITDRYKYLLASETDVIKKRYELFDKYDNGENSLLTQLSKKQVSVSDETRRNV